jgi:indole-3-glycerol phosphate synthase
MSILREIVRAKRKELKGGLSMAEARARAKDAPASRPFRDALRREGRVALIAEFKRASPVKGPFNLKLDPTSTAAAYERAGAAALSVLTNAFFQGTNEDLVRARGACGIPALRKEFTIDPVQIWEARALGADAILLLAQILDRSQLREFREIATELGMASLVEVFTEGELEAAVESGATIVGVNNRDLETFEVDLGRSLRLRERVPREVVFVSESGISRPSEVERLREAGVDAVLVGEELVRSGDPAARIRELFDPGR